MRIKTECFWGDGRLEGDDKQVGEMEKKQVEGGNAEEKNGNNRDEKLDRRLKHTMNSCSISKKKCRSKNVLRRWKCDNKKVEKRWKCRSEKDD